MVKSLFKVLAVVAFSSVAGRKFNRSRRDAKAPELVRQLVCGYGFPGPPEFQPGPAFQGGQPLGHVNFTETIGRGGDPLS